MAGDLVFYSHPMSRGRIVRWMLEEVGADYRTEWLDYGTPMQDPAFRAINPMAKVPALRHGDTIITECAAICAYLADAFPAAGLAPSPDQRGAYYRWLFFAAGPLENAITDRALGRDIPIEKQKMSGYGDFARVMDALELAVSGPPYIAGDAFSAADVYVGSQIGWGLMFKTIEPRPAFAHYWDRLKDRAAHRRASELDDAAVPAA
ncbi:MAG: glutathione S-transferase family protein [Rhodothalassiaceae bacterium]